MIIVASHKEYDDSILPVGYRTVKTGTNLSDEYADKAGWLRDNTGDNISDKNPYYCELTAQYWAWKNLFFNENDIMGLVHYRRFFFDYRPGNKDWTQDILTVARAKEILKTHKIILNFPVAKKPNVKYQIYKNQPVSEWHVCWQIIRKIIEKDYPEMLENFENTMCGHFNVWGNMFVTTGKYYSEYCDWLFGVFEKYEAELEKEGVKNMPRVIGFLAEQLLYVWVYSRFSEKDIYRLEVRTIEQDSFSDYSKSKKGRLMYAIRHNRPMLVAAKYARGIVLLTKYYVFPKKEKEGKK